MARKKNPMDDPGMKLFGRKIDEQKAAAAQIDQDVPRSNRHSDEADTPATSQLDDLGSSSGSCEDEHKHENQTPQKSAAATPILPSAAPVAPSNPSTVPALAAAPAPPAASNLHPDQLKEQSDKVAAGGAPRRPDKPVPCPRCNSMDTKFCYFNNYNVNQPRHFCKNCQRYWTAGGTLRNVPVGAGRRKSKHSNSGNGNTMGYHHHHHEHQHPHIRATTTIAGTTATTGGLPSLKPQNHQSQAQAQLKVARMRLPPILPADVGHFSGTAETSPSNSSLITSLNSSPNSGTSNIFSLHHQQQVKIGSKALASTPEGGSSPVGKSGSVCSSKSEAEHNAGSPAEKDSCRSCKPVVTAVPSDGTTTNRDCSGCSGGLFNNLLNAGSLWPYGFPWANAQQPQQVPSEQMQAEMASWLSSVWAAGAPAWTPFAWNMPWAFAAAFAAAASANGAGGGAGGLAAAAAAAAAAAPPFSAPKTLGKHARDKVCEGGRVEGCLWAPKTLRIDDPGEAAKSSFWTTLGLDRTPAAGGTKVVLSGGKDGGSSGGGDKNQAHVNPAALSRSLSFQENN